MSYKSQISQSTVIYFVCQRLCPIAEYSRTLRCVNNQKFLVTCARFNFLQINVSVLSYFLDAPEILRPRNKAFLVDLICVVPIPRKTAEATVSITFLSKTMLGSRFLTFGKANIQFSWYREAELVFPFFVCKFNYKLLLTVNKICF